MSNYRRLFILLQKVQSLPSPVLHHLRGYIILIIWSAVFIAVGSVVIIYTHQRYEDINCLNQILWCLKNTNSAESIWYLIYIFNMSKTNTQRGWNTICNHVTFASRPTDFNTNLNDEKFKAAIVTFTWTLDSSIFNYRNVFWKLNSRVFIFCFGKKSSNMNDNQKQ